MKSHGVEIDETPFASIADFFSLLSIAFIYFAVVFGSQSGSTSAAAVTRVDSSSPGAVIPDPRVANVSVLYSEKEGLLIRVIPPQGNQWTTLNVRAMLNPLDEAPARTTDILRDYPSVRTVVLYLGSDVREVSAYRLRDRIAATLSDSFEVRLAVD